VDEHPIDHPFVESDEVMSDDAEVATRRRWPIVVVSVVIVVVAIGAAFYVAASHYQPLSQSLDGGYGSEVLTSNGVLAASRASVEGLQGVVWTEPTASFRVEVVFTISNVQRFPVTIEKVTPPAIPSGSSDVRVFFDSKPGAPGAYGYKGGPSFTPTTLASKGQLELVIHWNEECVPTSADSGIETYRGVNVEYSFVGFHHTVSVPIQNLNIGPRSTC
jgi:hypothetical protein